jgi:hypothetical protein
MYLETGQSMNKHCITEFLTDMEQRFLKIPIIPPQCTSSLNLLVVDF